MKIQILPSKKSDPRVTEFENREWAYADAEHYGKEGEYFRESHSFVAQDENDTIVGSIDLIIEPNITFVESLLVDHTKQRQGIGKLLINFAEEFAKNKKCSKIYLETNQGWGAERFYKSLGYSITGKHDNHVFGQTTLIFTKFF